MSPIRILVADDHAIVREGVRLLLEAQPDMQVVGEAASGREAIALARQLRPDVVVMDISMPDINGLEATRRIKEELPGIEILALTVHESFDYFFSVLKAGASGYVVKGAASEDLINGVHAVSQGNVFLYPSVAKQLVADYLRRIQEGESSDPLDSLTRREREVLILIAEGHTNREIAERLVLSLSTIQTHYSNIMHKLNLENRTELVKYAIRRGLIAV